MRNLEFMDRGEHSKEVYAYFGLALYRAQCVEQSIIQLLIFGDFFPTEVPKFKSRIEWETRYDAFETKLLSRTMGQLLKILKKHNIVDVAFNTQLELALKRRNYLAHSYFVEHAQDFISFSGRKAMIQELEKDIELFDNVEDFLNPITMKFASDYGLSEEKFNNYFDELLNNALNADLKN